MRRSIARATLFTALVAAFAMTSAAYAQNTQTPAEQTNPAANNSAEPPAAIPLTPPAGDARFTFNRVGDDFLRMDRTTGQVSRCTQRVAGWSCQPVPEERAALESEMARLQDENAALKRRLEDRLADASPAKRPDANTKGYRVPDVELRLPTNEDIDRAAAAVERVWKRLMLMLNNIRSDMAEKI